jgi:voltage-gated potassium channel Kch
MLIVVLALAIVAGVLVAVLRVGYGDDTSFVEGAWQSLNRTFDPGTLSGDAGWRLRIVALFMTLLGILFVASLIGLIGAAIDGRIESLRKGRSFVVEQGHSLILGWSPRIFTIVSELVVANENQSDSCIVVLAPEEKTFMEDELADRAGDPGKTRIVCRTGDPASLSDLGIVNVAAARSIIVLSDDSPAGDGDAVKAVLAVMAATPGAGSVKIIAEMSDADTAEAIADATNGRVIPVRSTDVVARVTAQACRQSGLSHVFQELLDFDGDEIYFQPAPELVGHTFGEALLAYDTSSIIGRHTAAGEVQVNPPMDTVFAEGDEVIAVSEDDDTVVFGGFRDAAASPPNPSGGSAERANCVLILGWNSLAPLVLHQLDQFVTEGSTVDVLVHGALVDIDSVVLPPVERLQVETHQMLGGTEQFGQIVRAKPFDSVIILGYADGAGPAASDARTLLTLLMLKNALEPTTQRPRIVTELLDARDVELAVVTGADDFVVSDALASLMMAQLSEHPDLQHVFADLFDSDGAAVQMKPARRYVGADESTFGDVVAAAAALDEVALGSRRAGPAGAAEVIVNPTKSASLTLRDDDHVIVIGRP